MAREGRTNEHDMERNEVSVKCSTDDLNTNNNKQAKQATSYSLILFIETCKRDA